MKKITSDMTIKERIDVVFTDRQKELALREKVTKSLVLAVTKAAKYKQAVEAVVAKWVGAPTKDFMRVLPLITEKAA